MKLIIPQTKDLTNEVIKEEFFQRYYPELTIRQGWWKIYGRYVMLQKNPFVCADFFVKQKDKEKKTQIRIEKDCNFWAHLIGGPLFLPYFQKDFYKDVERNFKQFLTKKYGFREDEIEKEKWSFKNFMKDIWQCLNGCCCFLSSLALLHSFLIS